MAGYSGTPLIKKLGIKPGFVLQLVNPPADYHTLLGKLPEGVQVVSRRAGRAHLVHVFSKDRDELKRLLPGFLKRISPDGAIWVSWPKRSSGIVSTVTEEIIRQIALPLGLVDIKVCAVDQIWSGLKLVIRREKRKMPSE